MSYQVQDLTVGRIEGHEVEVPSALMSRARFLELFEVAFQKGMRGGVPYSQQTRDELLPVAETMPRFPIGTWVNGERGCGCVVGEFLVAQAEVQQVARENFIAMQLAEQDPIFGQPEFRTSTVEQLLEGRENKVELLEFGYNIDQVVRDELANHGISVDKDALVGNIYGSVASVEIVDEEA